MGFSSGSAKCGYVHIRLLVVRLSEPSLHKRAQERWVSTAVHCAQINRKLPGLLETLQSLAPLELTAM